MKFSDKAREVISAVAPKLGSALLGPLGGLAGNVISAVLGGDEKNVEEAILGQKPEVLMALRKAEQDFEVRMRELDLDESKLGYADVADARAMAAKTNMWPQITLSGVFIVGYFVLVILILLRQVPIPPEHKDVFNMLLGVLTVNVPIIMQFWFGSSHGSAKKTDMLKGG